MANIERWMIHPARRIRHDGEGTSLALGKVDPRPETDSEPFEVVRASTYRGAVALADATEEFLRQMDALENPRPAQAWFDLKGALHAFRGGQS